MTYGEPDRGHLLWSLGEEDSRPLIKHAVEQGINFFETENRSSLTARGRERGMIPLCLDEGVARMVWSRLARGRIPRAWTEARSPTRRRNGGFADLLYTPLTEASDHDIVDAVGRIADAR